VYYENRGHAMWKVIEMTCDDVQATYYPPKPELWMNPADWEDLGCPDFLSSAAMARMPVKTSLGVPGGSVRIFDRETLRYLPVARPALCCGYGQPARPRRPRAGS
jgi:hypothetical protein